MVARRTNDDPVKDSTGEWNLNLTNPHPNLPHIVVELALQKLDGTVETTQNQQGIFNLGNLPPGDYKYQYAAVNTLNPSARGTPINKEFTVPADPSTATTPPATATSTTSEAEAAVAEPLDELGTAWAEIERSEEELNAANLKRAINLEKNKELKNIITIKVDENNFDARIISLQHLLQDQITIINEDRLAIGAQKEHYKIHFITEIINKLENPTYPPTQAKIKELLQLKKITDLERGNQEVLDAHKNAITAIAEAATAATAARKKQKEAKKAAKKFEKKTIEKNLTKLAGMLESNQKYSEDITAILTDLSTNSTTIDVERLQNEQVKIGELMTDNDIEKDLEEINNFAEEMNKKIVELHNLSDEITVLRTEATSKIEAAPVAFKKFHDLSANQLGEPTTTTTSVSPTTTTTPGKRNLFEYLFGRS